MSNALMGTRAVGGRRVAAVIAALIVLMLSAGQAQASAPGAGVANGWEYAAEETTNPNPPIICATFDPAGEFGPLKIYFEMAPGTFHGVAGTGEALFTSTNAPYHASPEGTYQDENCTQPGDVPGTMTIDFDGFSCSGTATYERRATSAYVVDFTGSCDNGGGATDVLFTGAQVPCPCPTAPNPDPIGDPYGPSSSMTGDYAQT